jgi:hypothetical protein
LTDQKQGSTSEFRLKICRWRLICGDLRFCLKPVFKVMSFFPASRFIQLEGTTADFLQLRLNQHSAINTFRL